MSFGNRKKIRVKWQKIHLQIVKMFFAILNGKNFFSIHLTCQGYVPIFLFLLLIFSSKKGLDLISFTEIRRLVWWGSLLPSCKYPSAFTYGPIKANNNLGRAFPLSFPRYLEKKCHGHTLWFLTCITIELMQFLFILLK